MSRSAVYAQGTLGIKTLTQFCHKSVTNFMAITAKRVTIGGLVDAISQAHVLEVLKRGDLIGAKNCGLDDPFDGLQQR